ncbi:MAG: Dabb family protein, partial [Blastocatellia bacterium]|nr:Dabb family protein [Blastocatellia bacterium]
MLTHVVCWKYKAETTEAERREHVERLRSLSELVPGIKSFEVGSDVLGLERSYD